MVNKYILWEKENVNVSTAGIRHPWKVITIISMFCMCCTLLIGCGESELDDGDPIADNLSNLDDPKVREQILAEALDEDHLQIRTSPSGEELYYAPNQETPYKGWVKATDHDDVPYALWQMQNGKRHGIFLRWYSNQQNAEQGSYKNDAKEGLWTSWYENGQKEAEGGYKNDAQEGLWTAWHENGQKQSEGAYKDGSPEGLWTFWHENGQKQSEGMFKDGAKDGLWAFWHENGEIVTDEIGFPDAAFVSASPASGGLAANGSIIITFDNNPGDVTVTGGGTVSTSGKTRTISPPAAGYPAGALTITISWSNGDGSHDLTYTVIVADQTAPEVKSSSPKNDEEGVSVDLEEITVTFTEPIIGALMLLDGNNDLNWEQSIDGDTITLTIIAGAQLGNETEYTIAGTVKDGAGNKADVEITFVTEAKE